MPENVKDTSVEAPVKARPPAMASKKADGRVDRIVDETRQLSGDLAEWVTLRLKLIQIDIQERVDQELDFVFSGVIVLGMVMIALLMASFGAGYILGDWLGKLWYGFAIVAAVYLLAALIVFRTGPRLARGFRSSWIKSVHDREPNSSNGDQ